MGYALVHIELSQPLEALPLADGQYGWGIVARYGDRPIGFALVPAEGRSQLTPDEVRRLADRQFAPRILAMQAEREIELSSPEPATLPGLSIVICTKDRPVRLARLLASLDAVRNDSPFTGVEVVVVDNAPTGPGTRDAVAARPGVRYVLESKAGLNFARNAALRAAACDLIAYLDDDVVVDRQWLDGLARAWRGNPQAGGFTGLVLPFRLDTEAQLLFEQRGGFGRGFEHREFRSTSFTYPLHPIGAGLMGAGCNMAFDRRLLLELGGFDEALDTGAPLPGGGDLDIFYRVLRSGRAMLYEPQYAVYHEHRETIAQLRRQYWTWGLGMMAFLQKSRRFDPVLRSRQAAMVRWWLRDQLWLAVSAVRRRSARELRFHLAELAGGIQGLFGEYDRSLARSAAIRQRG